MSTLPSSQCSSLQLVVLTKAEINAQNRHSSTVWRGPLSVESFLRREEILASQALTKDSGITCWGLVDNRNPNKERIILAGCESIRKRALVARKRDNKIEVRNVVCHGVASVFCPLAFRGHGFAARMIEELPKILRVWQARDDECLFSVLYSDIGKKFYAKHGWQPYPSSHISIPVRSMKSMPGSQSSQTVVKQLLSPDLASLCIADEANIRKSLASMPESTTTFVVILPDFETIAWHHAREDYVAFELYGKKPDIKGALVEVNDTRYWCIFARIWHNENPQARDDNTLYILRFVKQKVPKGDIQDSDPPESRLDPTYMVQCDVEAYTALLKSALDQAEEWNMQDVKFWNPSSTSIVTAAQTINSAAKLIEREEDSIASLNWFGDPHEDVVWLHNEKYAWC